MKKFLSLLLLICCTSASAGSVIVKNILEKDEAATALLISGSIDQALSDSLNRFTQNYLPVFDTYLVLDNPGGFVSEVPMLKSSIQSLALKVYSETHKPLKVFILSKCASACIAVFSLVSNIKNDFDFSKSIEIKVRENAVFGFHGASNGAQISSTGTEKYLALLEKGNVSVMWIRKYRELFNTTAITEVTAKDLLSQEFHPQLQDMIF